jgi:hypothetical protein
LGLGGVKFIKKSLFDQRLSQQEEQQSKNYTSSLVKNCWQHFLHCSRQVQQKMSIIGHTLFVEKSAAVKSRQSLKGIEKAGVASDF